MELSVAFQFPPTETVKVTISADGNKAAKISPATLTFTKANYKTAQTVKISGKEGAAFNVSVRTKSADAVYDGLQDTWSYSAK